MSATRAALVKSLGIGRYTCALTLPQPAPGQQQ